MYRQERRIYHSTAAGVSASRGVQSACAARNTGCALLVWSVGSTSPIESIARAAHFIFPAWLIEGNHNKIFMAQKRKPSKQTAFAILMLSCTPDFFPKMVSFAVFYPVWRKPLLNVKRMCFSSRWEWDWMVSYKPTLAFSCQWRGKEMFPRCWRNREDGKSICVTQRERSMLCSVLGKVCDCTFSFNITCIWIQSTWLAESICQKACSPHVKLGVTFGIVKRLGRVVFYINLPF